jgi:hypothetical protein
MNGNYIATYESAQEANKLTGINFKYISSVCTGKTKSTHDYIFRFVDNGFN